jgi:integrase
MEQIPLEIIKEKLRNRYETQGYSQILFRNDFNLLLRLGAHPQVATTEDLQRLVMGVKSASTKVTYAARIRSMFKALRKMGLIDNMADLDLPAVRKRRGLPHPLTSGEAELLMMKANLPMKDWFTIGCKSGLRAMEVANLRGVDLEKHNDGYILRIEGKGGTNLSVPVADIVAQTILKHETSGKIWSVNPNKLTKMCSAEMKRLGIPKKTFHACRHYFATNMLEKSGGDLLAVRDLMRHSSVATTQVYTQLTNGRTRSLVNLLN